MGGLRQLARLSVDLAWGGISHHAQYGFIQEHVKFLAHLQAIPYYYKRNYTDALWVYFRSFFRFQITVCDHELSQREETDNCITSYNLLHCPKLEKSKESLLLCLL